MKYLLTIITLTLFSCKVYRPVYDEPADVRDIIYHGVHCPCNNMEFSSFSLTLQTRDSMYQTQDFTNNISKEYRQWIDTSDVCLDGCVVLLENIKVKDSSKVIDIKGRYYIDVLGLDME